VQNAYRVPTYRTVAEFLTASVPLDFPDDMHLL
jgi:hypothetical protein